MKNPLENIKVRNCNSLVNYGETVRNQFEIYINTKKGVKRIFQSFDSVIVVIDENKNVTLNSRLKGGVPVWKYSTTTGKYRNQFLGETKKETEEKIKTGEYKLAELD